MSRRGVLAHDFLGRIAGVFGKCLVDPQDHTVGIGDHHAFLRFEGGGGNAKIGLGLLPFCNILRYAEKILRLATIVIQCQLLGVQNVLAAVVGYDRFFGNIKYCRRAQNISIS